MPENIVQKTGTGFYDLEKLSGREMSTSKGQLILTDWRLVFIKYQGGRKILGIQVVSSGEDYSTRIDEGMKYEGSFEIPLGQIVEAKPDYIRVGLRKMFYLRLRYHRGAVDKSQSFLPIASQSELEFIVGEFARNIERLRKNVSTTASPPLTQTSNNPSPPVPVSPTPMAAAPAASFTPSSVASASSNAQSQGASPDAFQRLQRLKGMLDAGLINQQDYDEQKKKILESM